MTKSRPSRERSAAASRWRLAPWGVCVLAGLAYGNSLDVPLVYDDLPNIAENTAIHIDGLTPSELLRAATHGRLWSRPVANLSFALNYWWGELDTTGYHLVNVAVHLLASLLVYRLAFMTASLAQENGKAGSSPGSEQCLAAGVAMALFALHPLQTQSVTYVVQRMNSLATAAYLAAICCYLEGRLAAAGPRWRWFSAALACALIAVGSKEIAMAIPGAILLYEILILRPRWATRITPQQVLLAVAGLALLTALGLWALAASGVLAGYEGREFTLEERLLTQSRVVWRYAGLALFPAPGRLNLLHDVPLSRGLWTPPLTAVAMIAGAVYFGVGLALARRWPMISLGLLWQPLHLLLESTVIPLEMMYEHRMYLPLVGPVMAVGWAWQRWGLRGAARWLVPAALSLWLAAWTHARNETWRDALALWNDAVAKSPQSARALTNRGNVYLSRGRLAEAIRDFDRALEMQSGLVAARIARGCAANQQRRYREAADDLWTVVETAPNDELRVVALRNHGVSMAALGKTAEALDDYTRALRLSTEEVDSLFNRGNLRRRQGQWSLAREDYAECIRRSPRHAEAHNNLANLLALCAEPDVCDPALAVTHARRACELRDWRDWNFLETLSTAYRAAGDGAQAAKWLAQAAALAPQDQRPALREKLRQVDPQQPAGADKSAQ